MWRGGSSSQQNEEGWEVAFSHKGKSQAPPTTTKNHARGGVYIPDKLGIEAWKGRGSSNVEGEKPGHWANPNSDRDQVYKERGWKESGKPQQRNGNQENITAIARNVGGWGQDGKGNQTRQSSWKPTIARNVGGWGQDDKGNQTRHSSWKPGSSESVVGKMSKQDVVAPPPLANGWQWGSYNGGDNTRSDSLMASSTHGKGVGHGVQMPMKRILN